MKRAWIKRMAACLLALCLLVGMLPVSALAADPGDIVELKPNDSYTTPGGTVAVEGEESQGVITAITITDTGALVAPGGSAVTMDDTTGVIDLPSGSVVQIDVLRFTVTGKGGDVLDPKGEASRGAEAATMLARYCGLAGM